MYRRLSKDVYCCLFFFSPVSLFSIIAVFFSHNVLGFISFLVSAVKASFSFSPYANLLLSISAEMVFLLEPIASSYLALPSNPLLALSLSLSLSQDQPLQRWTHKRGNHWTFGTHSFAEGFIESVVGGWQQSTFFQRKLNFLSVEAKWWVEIFWPDSTDILRFLKVRCNDKDWPILTTLQWQHHICIFSFYSFQIHALHNVFRLTDNANMIDFFTALCLNRDSNSCQQSCSFTRDYWSTTLWQTFM